MRDRGRRSCAVLGAALLAVAALAVSPAPSAAGTGSAAGGRPPSNPARGQVWTGLQPGQPGTRCERAYEVRASDGRAVGCTHGPDLAPPGVDVREGRSTPQVLADAAAPTADTAGADSLNVDGTACIGDGTTGARIQAIYAVPSDRSNRSSTVVAAIRATYAPRIESQFARSAAESSGEVHVPFVTTATADGSCLLDVRVEVLSSRADDSFGNTVNELQARGYDRSDRKYAIWMDSNVLCGIGSIYKDSRPTQDNYNNGYAAMYGRSDAGCWAYAEGHELMHNLGGVQPTAPNSTPGYHCTDEPDDMCYDDDGAGPVSMRQVCTGRDGSLFDCNHDDYFHAGTPAAGSYLASNWNTYNSRFLHRGSLSTTPPPPSTNVAPAVSAGSDQTATAGTAITLDGTVTDDGKPSGTLTYQWSATAGPGTVAFGTPTAADTTATFPTAGTYTVMLTASDGALSSSDSATITVSAPSTTGESVFTGTLSSSDRSDTHTFASPPGTITVRYEGIAGKKVVVSLYDPSGRRLARVNSSGTFTFTGRSTVAGTHRLVLDGTGGAYTATVTYPT